MSRLPGSASDPLWYKDAIIYEVHVRCFYDANGDGVGDFRGLIQKLDYLQDLGVTCLWILPFFPSPLRDDGYDIADYTSVHPSYGTLEDFKEFLDAAHERDMQVLIELVINHTSDQHPWFQAARKAPPGSPERDYYVWSDSPAKYQGTRVIFTDTHTSNWSWDEVAGAYYWHRFFSHQPDLNFDNPAVVAEVTRAMQFWLDLGVDALRLDAIPYLVEREGTNCENLPETHDIIRQLRASLDQRYSGRMLLAEANQWPSDVRAYFGEENECHMAFHFPLMPRLFMALRLEDRHPVTEIMRQTPAIPDSCQWGLFLRNHDELTLEMVTDEERDYMYFAYSADPRMRVNVGIRRRLAPLLENDRSRIELLMSILLSFPGTPILYYGDEIGMGDNIYLGDRHGVRTPMQWSADRNAGFSRANPARLYSPVIMDALYGYEAINVEAQQIEPGSLLNWTRHMLRLRKLFGVFGRGSIEFLTPTNRKILAYVRRQGDEQVLCVANLSRFAQPFELDLTEYAGLSPVEMRGYVEFPRIKQTPYPLTLGPYGFLWFELQSRPEEAPVAVSEQLLTLPADNCWVALLAGEPRGVLENRMLPEFLPRQRWFGGKARTLSRCRIEDGIRLGDAVGLLVVQVRYVGGVEERYLVPVGISFGAEADRLREERPGAIMGQVTTGIALGVLHDATLSDSFCLELLRMVREGASRGGQSGSLVGEPGRATAEVPVPESGWPVTRIGAEQSNSSIIYGEDFILKLFRRPDPGPNPDAELTRYLSEVRGFTGVPAYAGSLEYVPSTGEGFTAGLMQRLVSNQGDGFSFMVEELGRYYERAQVIAPDSLSEGPAGFFAGDEAWLTPELDKLLGISDDAANALGRRTAAMHLALDTPTSERDLAPEALTPDDLRALAEAVQHNATMSLDLLKEALSRVPENIVELASRVIGQRARIAERVRRLADLTPGSHKIRIHGDYHLGQVLRVRQDFVLLDFEGEPAKPLSVRRARYPALKDVAGMLRSFSYAAGIALQTHLARRPGDPERMEYWARLWERSVSATFLDGYRQVAGTSPILPAAQGDLEELLDAYLLDKALYELRYELGNRPAWVRLPLQGIVDIIVGRSTVPAGRH